MFLAKSFGEGCFGLPSTLCGHIPGSVFRGSCGIADQTRTNMLTYILFIWPLSKNDLSCLLLTIHSGHHFVHKLERIHLL